MGSGEGWTVGEILNVEAARSRARGGGEGLNLPLTVELSVLLKDAVDGRHRLEGQDTPGRKSLTGADREDPDVGSDVQNDGVVGERAAESEVALNMVILDQRLGSEQAVDGGAVGELGLQWSSSLS